MFFTGDIKRALFERDVYLLEAMASSRVISADSTSLLIEAIDLLWRINPLPEERRLRIISNLIFSGVPVNISDGNGRTPLQRAVYYSDYSLTELLLPYSRITTDVLYTAVLVGSLDILKLLLDEVKSRNQKDFMVLHESPLCLAIDTSQYEVAHLFVSASLFLNDLNHIGMTPFELAVKHGNLSLAEEICVRVNPSKETLDRALAHAIANLQLRSILYLLEKGATLPKEEIVEDLLCSAFPAREQDKVRQAIQIIHQFEKNCNCSNRGATKKRYFR